MYSNYSCKHDIFQCFPKLSNAALNCFALVRGTFVSLTFFNFVYISLINKGYFIFCNTKKRGVTNSQISGAVVGAAARCGRWVLALGLLQSPELLEEPSVAWTTRQAVTVPTVTCGNLC